MPHPDRTLLPAFSRNRIAATIIGLAAASALVIAGNFHQHLFYLKSQNANIEATLLKCRVTYPDGGPAGGALIMFTAPAYISQPLASASTTPAGECAFEKSRLPPLTFIDNVPHAVAIAQLPGMAPGIGLSEAWRYNTANHISIALCRPDNVTLHIVDPAGRPQTDTVAYIRTLQQGTTRADLPLPLIKHYSGVSDKNGNVTFRDLPHGDRTWLETDDPRFAAVEHTAREAISLDGTSSYVRTAVFQPASVITGKVCYAPASIPAKGITLIVSSKGSQYGTEITTTKTQSDGSYRVGRLHPGAYSVNAVSGRAGWTSDIRDVTIVRPGTSVQADMTVRRQARLTVHVLTTTGAPVTSAVIGGAALVGSFTNSDGTFSTYIAPGAIKLYIERLPEGYHNADSSTKNLTVSAGEAAAVTFRVMSNKAAAVTGNVIGPDGRPLGGAIVQLCSMKEQVSGKSGIAEWGRFEIRTHPLNASGVMAQGVAVSDKNGHFAIDSDWLSNARILWASHGATDATRTGVRAFNGRHYVLQVQSGTMGWMSGKVLDTSGKPLANVKVSLVRWRNRDNRQVSLPMAITDRHGQYEIGSLPPGEAYSIEVNLEGYGFARYPKNTDPAARIVLSAGEMRQVPPIVLPHWTRTISGKVVDTYGAPVAYAKVAASGDLTGIRRGVTDEYGRFKLDQIAAEQVYVTAYIEGISPQNAGGYGGPMGYAGGPGAARISGYSKSPGGYPSGGLGAGGYPGYSATANQPSSGNAPGISAAPGQSGLKVPLSSR